MSAHEFRRYRLKTDAPLARMSADNEIEWPTNERAAMRRHDRAEADRLPPSVTTGQVRGRLGNLVDRIRTAFDRVFRGAVNPAPAIPSTSHHLDSKRSEKEGHSVFRSPHFPTEYLFLPWYS